MIHATGPVEAGFQARKRRKGVATQGAPHHGLNCCCGGFVHCSTLHEQKRLPTRITGTATAEATGSGSGGDSEFVESYPRSGVVDGTLLPGALVCLAGTRTGHGRLGTFVPGGRSSLLLQEVILILILILIIERARLSVPFGL